jgi:hydrogenase maturation protease
MMPRKCLVAGLGNPLQGSDGFGQAVLARLGERTDLPEHTELPDAHTDLLRYVARFASYDLVVLVDANLGPRPGRSRCPRRRSLGRRFRRRLAAIRCPPPRRAALPFAGPGCDDAVRVGRLERG